MKLAVADVIADLVNENRELRRDLDRTKKWGECGWKRWDLLRQALEASQQIDQEP